jgi:hypothetical protein
MHFLLMVFLVAVRCVPMLNHMVILCMLRYIYTILSFLWWSGLFSGHEAEPVSSPWPVVLGAVLADCWAVECLPRLEV